MPPVILTLPTGPRLALPVTVMPSPDTTNTFAFPFALILTLPSINGMLKLLVPLDTPEVLTETKDRLPEPSVWTTCPLVPPAILTLDILFRSVFPVTTKLATFAPTVDTTTTFATPPTPIVMLPLIAGMFTLLVPFAILFAVPPDACMPDNWLPLPK